MSGWEFQAAFTAPPILGVLTSRPQGVRSGTLRRVVALVELDDLFEFDGGLRAERGPILGPRRSVELSEGWVTTSAMKGSISER